MFNYRPACVEIFTARCQVLREPAEGTHRSRHTRGIGRQEVVVEEIGETFDPCQRGYGRPQRRHTLG